MTKEELQTMLEKFFKLRVRIQIIEPAVGCDGIGEIHLEDKQGNWHNIYKQVFTQGKGIDNMVRFLITWNFMDFTYNKDFLTSPIIARE